MPGSSKNVRTCRNHPFALFTAVQAIIIYLSYSQHTINVRNTFYGNQTS